MQDEKVIKYIFMLLTLIAAVILAAEFIIEAIR